MFFLNLWEPHDNYFIMRPRPGPGQNILTTRPISAAARHWTLSRYYTMCNDLLAELESYPELIALHKAYVAQGTWRHQ